MGGGTALFGLLQGFRPAALVLVDIAPNAAREGMEHVVTFMRSGLAGFASIEEAADAVAAYLPHRPRPRDLDGLRKNLRSGPDGRWRWHWDPGMVANGDIDAERAIMMRSFDILATTDVPLLLVRGMLSDVVTDETVREFRVRVPALEVLEIHGAAHMVAGDKNDVFSDGIQTFLARCMPSR